ncbi:MAG: 3-deoxy-manno-octulosonate cytidylyltransferase [Weeksellaceae bacterium]
MKLNIIAVIPARYNATRFPGKLLKDLNGESVIYRTYQSVVNTGIFKEVIAATDDDRILENITSKGGKAVKTSPHHQSGSDRIAEVVQHLDVDVVVNIQGDEPFILQKDLESLVQIFQQDVNKSVHVATLVESIQKEEDIKNPNNVKVVLDESQHALYFSRSVIPYQRDSEGKVEYLKHIGIYAFRKEALLEFTQLPQGNLEKIEKLEQLRYLENGYKIKVAYAEGKTIGIDTEEDLEFARRYMKLLKQ